MRSLSSSLKVGVTTTLLYTYSPTTSKQEWYTCTNPLSFMEMLLAPIPGVPSRNHRLSKLSINASDRWHHNSTKEQGIIRTEEFEQFPHRGLVQIVVRIESGAKPSQMEEGSSSDRSNNLKGYRQSIGLIP